MFGFRDGVGICSLVDPKLGLHAGFFVKDLANRGRLITAVFLVRQCLESAIEGNRKRDCNSDRFLVPHGADRVIRPTSGQEKFRVDWCMIQ